MAKLKTISIKAGQSLFDIALQEYGNPEGVILLLQANPGLSLADELQPNSQLIIWSQEAVSFITDVLKVEPYASNIQNLLIEWASLIPHTSSTGGGTTTELSAGFGIDINNFIASINLDDLHDSPAITKDDIIIFIHPDESGTNRYRKIALSEALKLQTFTSYLNTLADVDVTTRADRDLLVYDIATELWKNDPIYGIAALPDVAADTPMLYLKDGRFAWMSLGNGLTIENGALTVTFPAPGGEQLWRRADTTLSPENEGDSVDLKTGNITAAGANLGTGSLQAGSATIAGQVDADTLRAANKAMAVLFNADGNDGLTGNITVLTGCSVDTGRTQLTFTRRNITHKGGIITAVTNEADLVVGLK